MALMYMDLRCGYFKRALQNLNGLLIPYVFMTQVRAKVSNVLAIVKFIITKKIATMYIYKYVCYVLLHRDLFHIDKKTI